MKVEEGDSVLQVIARKELRLQPPVFQTATVFSVIFFGLPARFAMGRPDGTGLVKYKPVCFQYIVSVSRRFSWYCCLEICFFIGTALLFQFSRVYTGSDGHADAACCSCYSSRDVQNLHNGRGMIFTIKLVLNGISENVSWSGETPDVKVKL